MKDWLVKRLTPQKATEERWISLSRVLQELWEFFFDPALSRLERLRSYYQADEADLDRKLREMGDYFQADFFRFEDKPIAVSWRNLELKYKDLELILSSALRRHFKNLPVGWLPLFAPEDQPYGAQFVRYGGLHTDTEKNAAPAGMFLTSRGMLGVDYGYLLRMRMFQDAFLERADPILRRTKPLHIVYDGPVFYIRHEIPVEMFIDTAWRDILRCELMFSSLGGRFDFTPGDSRPIDISSLEAAWATRDEFVVPFWGNEKCRWHLDMFMGEGLHPWLPLDIVVPGIEGTHIGPFWMPYAISSEGFRCAIRPHQARPGKTLSQDSFRNLFRAAPECTGTGMEPFSMRFEMLRRAWCLDMFRSQMPDAWLPLDMSAPGVEGDFIPPVWIPFERIRNHIVFPGTPLKADSRFCRNERFELGAVEASAHLDLIVCSGCEIPFSLQKKWHLDIPVSSPDGWVPQDVYTEGTEGESSPPLSCPFAREKMPVAFPFSVDASLLGTGSASVPSVSPEFTCDCIIDGSRSSDSGASLRYTERGCLDLTPRYDEIPADFMPLDTLLGGAYA